MISPTINPNELSIEDKIKLIKESDGLLIELLERLNVEGDLYLEGCASLTHLPDGLNVEGDLYLEGCASLTHLPDGLNVGGSLDLEGCTSLSRDFPKSMKIKGTIYDVPGDCNEN